MMTLNWHLCNGKDTLIPYERTKQTFHVEGAESDRKREREKGKETNEKWVSLE